MGSGGGWGGDANVMHVYCQQECRSWPRVAAARGSGAERAGQRGGWLGAAAPQVNKVAAADSGTAKGRA